MSRRDVLKKALAAASCAALPSLARMVAAMGEASLFRLALLRYGGNWRGRPTALETVLSEVELRTSVPVAPGGASVAPQDAEVFSYPLLWMTGDEAFGQLSPRAVQNLGRHLRFGGTLFADDTSGERDSAFRRSLHRELASIFPSRALEPLPSGHALYRSYYYLGRIAGRTNVQDYLEGIHIDDRAAVIFCANDLSGALEREGIESWRYGIESGLREDRTLARRLAVNLVIYALTVNYKLDQVHISYRLRHPQRYPALRSPSSEGAGPR